MAPNHQYAFDDTINYNISDTDEILLNFRISSYMLGQSVPQLIYAITKLS